MKPKLIFLIIFAVCLLLSVRPEFVFGVDHFYLSGFSWGEK